MAGTLGSPGGLVKPLLSIGQRAGMMAEAPFGI